MATKKKGPVFRVTGLPASQPDDELKVSLKTFIDNNLSSEERSESTITLDIVPSCYYDEKVALVEFHSGVPGFLAELAADPLGDWDAEMDGFDINFDRHFHGFTQLYTPKPDTPITADIIAITGLDGHAYGSWRGKGNLGRMWLRHFLSRDMPCCRTMTYGYNSKLTSHGVDTIMDYGRELLEELKKIRDTDELRTRPLFFIAHSFGGIILAHCLVKAVQTTEDDNPTIATLHRATYSMCLFGIPHKGLMVDDFEQLLAGDEHHSRNALLQQIKSKSAVLESQLADFKNLIRDRKVVSFYETGQTRQLKFNETTKRWERTGDFVLRVDTESSLLHLPDSVEEKIKLDSDHSMIVKFANQNSAGYVSMRKKLQQFEKDAPNVVAARFMQKQNKPKPSSTVPFSRDTAFVGREDILTKVSEMLKPTTAHDHERVALVGLGGVGKSQIAIEYAHRLRQSAPQTWVFWVHASDTSRFKQSYKDIADKVELPDRNDPTADIFDLVYKFLCDERNGPWLIILDNADDYQVLLSADTNTEDVTKDAETNHDGRTLASFLPQTNGRILVTSRDNHVALSIVGRGHAHKIIPVEPMDEKDNLKLLRSTLSILHFSDEDGKALIELLGGIPLAITQAAAYIRQRQPSITIPTYLELFRASEENQVELLSTQEGKDIRRDHTASDAALLTLWISFEQIRKAKPEAADLLCLMAMFDRNGIPESLLHQGRDKLQFEEVVTPLTSFSLIKSQITTQSGPEQDQRLFEMHRLVQLATTNWLKLHNELKRWQNTSLKIMASAFPDGEHETWAECQLLLPHSRKVLGYVLPLPQAATPTSKLSKRVQLKNLLKTSLSDRRKNPTSSMDLSNGDSRLLLGEDDTEATLYRATIAHNTAWYLNQMGEYAAAEHLFLDATAVREALLGQSHKDTRDSVSHMGVVYMRRGKYKEAEAIFRKSQSWLKSQSRPGAYELLFCLDSLGAVLAHQDKHKEAETMYRRSVEISTKLFGPEDKGTLDTMSNLANTIGEQGRWQEEEELESKLLELYKRVVGPEHPATLNVMGNLTKTLIQRGRWQEAEDLGSKRLELSKKVLGLEHPDTVHSMHNLASVLARLERWTEAEDLGSKALELSKKVLGLEHPETVTSMDNLASLLTRLERWKEAEDLERQLLELYKRLLEPEHPDTLFMMGVLAINLFDQGRKEEALSLMRPCAQGLEKRFGSSYSQTEEAASLLRKWEKET